MSRFLFLFFLLLSLQAQSQSILDQKVSIQFNGDRIEKCLVQLEKQTGITFSYNSKQLSSADKKHSGDYTEIRLGRILDDVLSGTSFTYKEIGGQITVFELKESQTEVVISGYIRDAASKEEIVGARIYFPDLGKGCISNSYGYYAMEVPRGLYRFTVSSVGMERIIDTVDFQENIVINFNLSASNTVLAAVEISADSIRTKPTPPQDLSTMDEIVLNQQAILRLPAVAGEMDVIKYLHLFPGVQPSQDGGANYQIRGSGTGNNLILLDEIPIYHPTHMLGVYSIVNVEAIRSATLYKDFIPLRFGTRNASVLQIHTKEGNMEKYHTSGGISLVSGRINFEGPIVKDRASFYFSARRSFFPSVANQLLNQQKFTFPSFHDLNGKMNVHLNSNNRLYFTGYYGRDHLSDTTADYRWGNTAGAIRWNHVYNSKVFSNLSLTHSAFDYRFNTNALFSFEEYGQTVVTDQLSYNFTHFANSDLRLEYGVTFSWIRTKKGNNSAISSDLFLERSAFENGVYFAFEKRFSPSLILKGGVRVPYSFHIGTQDTSTYLNPDLSYTTVLYEKNKLYDLEVFADPRLLLTWYPDDHNRIQWAANVTSQHTHIINYVNYFLPIEIWTTSNAFLKPERSLTASLGWVHQQKHIETSITVFDRHVFNVIDYASPVYTPSLDIESNLLTGNLHAYGCETQINFNYLPLYTASVSFTYTKSVQQIDGVNENNPYPSLNDRPYYFSFSQYFNLTPKWQLSTAYSWHSGSAITLPNGQFIIDGIAFPLYSMKRNAERLPYFSRFDVSITRKLGVKKKRDHFELVLTFTNLFNRTNHSSVFIDYQYYYTNKTALRSIDYSPFMITLNINFKF